MKTKLEIAIDNDGRMSWTDPAGKTLTVQPGEPCQPEVFAPHRLGQQERRQQDQLTRKKRASANNQQPAYQVASELVLHTGPLGRNWWVVAEIADDESGEKAHSLMTAIEFVSAVVRADAVRPSPALPAAGPEERYE